MFIDGTWEDRYREVLAAQDRLELIYTNGQPGGSPAAMNDLQGFCDRSIALGEWAANAAGITLKDLQKRVMALGEPWIALARDLAIVSKHSARTRGDWAGDPHVAVTSQSATVFPHTVRARVRIAGSQARPADQVPSADGGPVKSTHRWTTTYTPQHGPVQKIDVLALTRDVVAQWALFLPTLGLKPPS